MQRLRIRFRRGEPLKYISHLDLIRLWERALRRARIPLVYSEGFSPHPRISLAAPLSVGVTSDCELMDVVVANPVSPHWFTSAVSSELPPGIEVPEVYPIAAEIPSLQAQVRFAEYEVEVGTELNEDGVRTAITGLLARESLPWHHMRDTGRRDYDLRRLIDDLWLVEMTPDGARLGMSLRCDSSGSGRPEQVAVALGFNGPPRAIRRTRLVLGATPQPRRPAPGRKPLSARRPPPARRSPSTDRPRKPG
jgi:radical SAM-linked protein